MTYLHSIIFILKPRNLQYINEGHVFTFYNIYIKTNCFVTIAVPSAKFTFYNIYIKTGAKIALAIQ